MDLALLVYGISVLTTLQVVLSIALAVLLLVLLVSTLNYLDSRGSSYREPSKLSLRWARIAGVSLAFVTFALIITPSEKTMYTMVGAYAAQKVAEDPKVQQLSGKVLKLVETKLDSYIEQAEKKVSK